MTFEVSATINTLFRYAGNVDGESYEEAFFKAQSILENSIYNENSVELLMPIAKAESTINEWITEAAARFKSETGTEINPDILLERLSDCDWIWSCAGWTEDTAYEECINLTSAKKQLDRITDREIEYELDEQESSERFFTDGDTLLDMDGMRYQFEEAKKLGETEATRLAEYIDEWLTDFFSTREISKEEYIKLRDKHLPTWLPEGSTEITTAYAEDNDMTFILKETYNAYHEPISTEVIGFYFGRPYEDMTREYTGRLKAEY